jgi:hypothetical protein
MSVTITDVSDLFQRYLWNYKIINTQTVRSGFKGKLRSYLIDATLQNKILTLGVWDYLPLVPKENQAELFRRLLELNSEISLVKFALADSEIMVLADMPAEGHLDYNLFVSLLEMLAFYAEDSYEPLYKRITGREPPEGGKNE